MMIYFIRNGQHVKIGRARNPQARIAQLQTAHPDKLEITATMPGGPDVEKALHQYFADKRGNGEWFLLTDDEVFTAIEEFRTMGAATLEEALRLSNWLSILTYDVVKYIAAGGEVVVEWTDEALVLRLPGVAAKQVHSKFRRLVEASTAPEPAAESGLSE